MGRGHNARSSTHQPYEGYPALGAFHDVVPSEQLRSFLFDFSRTADHILKRSVAGLDFEPVSEDDWANRDFFEESEKYVEGHPKLSEYDFRDFGKIFDIERLGVSVVEMGQTERAARRVRAIWEGNDFGAVEQEARDEIGRYTGLGALSLKFSGVIGVGRRLPGVRKENVRQKLALLPTKTSNSYAVEVIEKEHQIITDAISRRFNHPTTNWETIPHLTFAFFNQSTSTEAIGAIEESIDTYSRLHPCGARLGKLLFRHMSPRNKKRQG